MSIWNFMDYMGYMDPLGGLQSAITSNIMKFTRTHYYFMSQKLTHFLASLKTKLNVISERPKTNNLVESKLIII